MRYTVHISFVATLNGLTKITSPIFKESVKTLKEAMGYGEIIDESVESAFIVDNSNNKIVKKFK